MAFSFSNGSIVLFYVNWAVMAVVGAGTLPVTWTRAVNNHFDARKGLALGLSLLGTGIFGFLIKPFTAWLIATYGWRTTYLVIGMLPLLLAWPIAYFAFHDVGERTDSSAERRKASAARLEVTPGLRLGQALKSWRYWVLAFAFVCVSFGVGGPIPNMENILKVAGFERDNIVSLVALIGLSVIAGRIIGGWLIDRFWAPGIAFVMLSLPALSCWLMADGGMSVPAAGAAIFLIGFAAGVEYDLMAFLVARYFGMKGYSAIYGSLYGFFALGAGIGPVVFGKVFDKTGSYAPVLGTSAALLMIGAVSLLFLGRYQRYEN
jgi:predicted MFS family arabinose efflux permease